MKQTHRASTKAALCFIHANDWLVEAGEVIIPGPTREDPKERLPLRRFCERYVSQIETFDKRMKEAKKVALRRKFEEVIEPIKANLEKME